MKAIIGPYPNGNENRVVTVLLDPYDTWNMDHTLALIIVPMLKQLKATKHGCPFVDDEYVPEDIRSTAAPPKQDDWDIDDYHVKRWDYVLNEMIWAMEQIADNDDESQFYDHSCVDDDDWISKIKCDHEALDAHRKRITNGTKLFGIFFQNLWD